MCGEGVVASLVVDDVELKQVTLVQTDTIVVNDTLHAALHVGSTVDLELAPGASDGCDSTTLTAVITVQ